MIGRMVLLLILLGWVREGMAASGELDRMSIKRERDSVWIELGFKDGRPARYRVMQQADSTGTLGLQIEFQPAGFRPSVLRDKPDWVSFRPGVDSGFSVVILLDRGVPWKSEWQDRVLQVSFPDRIQTRSLWRSPWLVAGVSAALAGGTAFWLLGTNSAQSPVSGDGVIPPPDILLPR